MSSITQAKAEAQKLIKRYNKLQAEARQADSAEAARKAAEAEKLVSQISALQGAITKLQAKDREVAAKKQAATNKTAASASAATTAPASIEGLKQGEAEKAALESRIMRIEDAQKKTRAQIDQLTRAKAELTRLKQEAEKNAATVVQERRANDERLQQELANLIKQKETEHQNLKDEIEAIRAQAKKDAELLKIQRDAARAMMEKQKKLEEEKRTVARHGKGHRGLWIGLGIGVVLIAFLVVVVFMKQPKDGTKTRPASPAVASSPKATLETSKEAEESPAETVSTPKIVKPIGVYRDRLASGGQGPVMVKLPAGEFMMGNKGSSIYQDERPQHAVSLQSFSISKYEVTFGEYDRFASTKGLKMPDDRGWGRGNQPVINVNWDSAVEYTKWLTEQTGHQYRLPSEREWEYAAKAGTDSPYWWGYEKKRNKANCAICGSQWDGKQTAPIGSFPANAFGLHDVIGNVMEWTLSCYRTSYRGAPKVGQTWEGGTCSKRMARSSSFRSYEKDLRVTRRNSYSPKTQSDTLGFRVVRVD